MSRESEVAVLLAADATLDTILTGGVYSSAALGRDGITRDSAPGSFDSDGYLKPSALVRQRGAVPFGEVRDLEAKVQSSSQVVEIWCYEDTNFTAIDSALDRIYTLLQGHALPGAYPMEWSFTLDRTQDEGSLKGSAMARIDFQIKRHTETIMKLNWLGSQYSSLDSYGRYSNGMIRALQSFGVDVRPLLADSVTMPQWMAEQERIDWSRLTISCMPALYTQPAPTGTRHWLLSMWEMGRLPTHLAEQVNRSGFERIIVPCKAVEDAFRRGGVTGPIHIIPGGIDPDEFPLRPFGLDFDHPYTFLAMADRASRKGWMEAWDAFYKAFGPTPEEPTRRDNDVRLLIKCRKDGNEGITAMQKAANRDPRITFWEEDVADPADIYAAADCFVIPSRFEGWGLPAREAACTGMPVITQRYSGMDDGHTSEWAIVVEGGKLQRIIDPEDESDLGEWRKCDVDELAKVMRHTCAYAFAAAYKAREAAKWIRDNQTWKHSAQALVQLIDEVGAVERDVVLQAVYG